MHAQGAGNVLNTDVKALLGEGGALARHIDGFAQRPVQQQMAQSIAAAIDQGHCLVAEAGTGTGKTFAYLVPALVSGQRVIISTGTRTLQDQLYRRDLPTVLRALEISPRTALLKGRSNYLCLHRLDLARTSGDIRNPEWRDLLEQLNRWSRSTRSGELAEFASLTDDSPMWPRVTSNVDNCLGTDCAFIDDCYLIKARRRAQEADLVVVNHHLLFADMALKQEGFGELLPKAGVVIVDEAHQLPDTASLFFGQTFSARLLRDLARDARQEAAQLGGSLRAVDDLASVLDHSVAKLRLCLEGQASRGSWPSQMQRPELVVALTEVEESLQNLGELLDQLAASSTGIESCAARCAGQRAMLGRIAGPVAENHVAWYESFAKSFQVHLTPLDVAEPMCAFRQSTQATWVFTSATLSVKDGFDLFNRQMGLDQPDTLLLASPFDFEHQSLLYHPQGLPDPSEQDYVVQLINAILPVVLASRGRAFLLFTSHRNLQLAAAILRQRCELPLFVQGERSRHLLLQAFRTSGNGLLLGAASFWQGVDVRGDALSCVIIDKLPFAAPDDPVLEARLEMMRRAGVRPFPEYQLPSAVLTLKQGAGRLIRDMEDRGILVICDPRLSSRGYGKVFLDSLPPMPYTRDPGDIERFFAGQSATVAPVSNL